MPFRSTAQQRFAFGTGQSWAKRWANETDFSRLPKRVRKKRAVRKKVLTLKQLELFVSSDQYDPDTADLIAACVAEIPRLKGEQIAPGITRIRGNLCNVHGRYGPCDKAQSGKKPKGKRAARKPAKPKQTPAQRAQARQQQRDQNIADVAKQMAANDTGLSPSGVAALTAFANGQQPTAAQGDGLVAMGLAEKAPDGTYRMTATGHGVVNAMAAGDYQRALDGISRGTERTGARQERQTARAARQQAATERRAAAQAKRQAAAAQRAARQAAAAAKKPAASAGGEKKPASAAPTKTPPTAAPSKAPSSGGGGGGGGAVSRFTPKEPPKPEKPAAPTKQETTAANQASVRDTMMQTDQGLAPAGFDNLIALGGGKEPDQIGAEGLISMGMAERGSDGTLRLTSAGRAAIAAANRGDAKAAIDVISRASEPKTTTKAGSPGDYLIVDNPQQSTTWHLQVKRNGKPDHGLMGAAWAALHSGFRGNTYQGPQKGAALAKLKKLYAAEGMPLPTEKTTSFQVFKDARGQWRWVAQSSTAYQDRDKEIVSTKALADDCAYADQHDAYGPLRWWHTPGLDLGDCDFNAMHGRVLIESGTFRTPQIAQKVAAAAGDLEISLGFLHLPTEPDAAGVFHHIRRFERSLVPRGKASNRFTAFRVKETPRMLDATKVAALKTLGFSDDDITTIQAQAAATEKAADEQQIAYKADEPAGDAAQEITIAGVTYQLVEKAAVPQMMAAAPDEEAPAEDMAEGGMEEPGEDTGDGLTLSPEDIAAIGQAVAQALQSALGPLVSTMDLTNKIGSHMDELKSMMGGYTAKKDAESAQTAEQLAALTETVKAHDATLADLTGLQPEVVQRPSVAPQSMLNPFNPVDAALLQAAKEQGAAPEHISPFEDLKQKLFSA